jgi:copper chaperone CopZ
VRSALLAVKGVTRAQVSLEGHEALVTYDPGLCKVEDLVVAVGKAEGPMMANQYTAAIKK